MRCLPQMSIQKTNAADTVSRIPYRLAAAAIICLCDQNPELITPRATARPLFGLAAGGVYHAAELSLPPGGLLPHPFTLTCRNRRSALCCTCLSAEYSLRHPSFQRGSLLCAVRTFLNAGQNPAPRLPASTAFRYNITTPAGLCKLTADFFQIFPCGFFEQQRFFMPRKLEYSPFGSIIYP